ncbi:MAG: DUF2177 family protein [Gammaproteobacteria bacterium]|nr:MAG: DUF2177 family protein [Gammaproteobacteria bacterium]
MFNYIVGYFGAAVVFCLMDFIWLGFIAKNFYRSRMGSLMLAEPKLIPAAAFYILYLLGLLIFAILPAARAQNFLIAASLGALVGLIAYSCYDLTNLATLKGWSTSLSLVDIAWGIIVSASASAAGYWVIKILAKN